MLVVSSAIPARTVEEFIAWARSKPGEVNYGSSGVGTTPHLTGALFAALARLQMVHVPYRGAQAAYQDLMAGRIDLFFDSTATAKALVEGKSVHALAVSSRKRLPAMPDVPTLHDTGVIKFSMESWSGIFLPAKTPEAIVVRLRAEMARMMADPSMQQRIRGIGQEPVQMSGEETERFVKAEVEQWTRQLRAINLSE